ncbi:MAG: flagellar hook protein FlgE [Spirochaetales bacterium]|nr:flagellar hook protein FlgE [Spirochaetales bacterium]
MMRSLYSGVSGLENHQTRMDVIGNNIANVNTTGFKKGRVTFQDMISQTVEGAARPNDAVGGVNPQQVGLGMNVAAIDTVMTQGSLQTTGVNTDLALEGNGFFVLKDGDKTYYTRAGSFGIDSNGTLVNPANGLRVQGWMAQEINGQPVVRTAQDPTDLTIPVGAKDPAHATQNVDLACNLDKRTPVLGANATPIQKAKDIWEIDKTIYDSFGNTHRVVIDLQRDPNAPNVPNQWLATVQIDPQNTQFNPNLALGFTQPPQGNTFVVNFSNLGALASIRDAQGNVRNAGKLQIPVTFTVNGANPGANQTQTFNLNLGSVGSYTNSVTQFADQFSTKSYKQDGYGMGYLENFQIDASGQINGIYSNGTNRLIGQIALATFINPGGLEKEGSTMFAVSNNSGDANVGPSGIAGKGKIIAGALEMSNVDLAEAFTDMIVTERGFQANSRTITTSDQMLQELLTLKR